MSGEPPTSFENYPPAAEPEPDRTLENRWETPPAAPVVRRYQPITPRPPTGYAKPASRRTVMVGLLGASAAIVGVWGFSSGAASHQTSDGGGVSETVDPFDQTVEEPDDSTSFDLGGSTFQAPQGWTVEVATDTTARITNGANQLLVVAYDTDAVSATDEIKLALKRSDSPFVGSAGKAEAGDSDGQETAKIVGTGKYKGKGARQLAELWLDTGNGQALFSRQVLTAAAGSSIAKQSKSVVDDLRDYWPW